ncbi:MAG: hypothetical protein JOZ22_18165 [Acidobacteriia bacterium]|nr:hypothetical protein [Terriglobia bacterium]
MREAPRFSSALALGVDNTMLPAFLIPETTVREAGSGQEVNLGDNYGGVFILTLGITRILEHESLDISIWGSSDGYDWGTKPIISFPQKFYCGTYQVQLDLSERPEIRHLQARWHMSRWGRSQAKPLFTIYLFAEIMKPVLMAAGV